MAKSFYIKNVFVPVSKPMYALLEEKGLSPWVDKWTTKALPIQTDFRSLFFKEDNKKSTNKTLIRKT